MAVAEQGFLEGMAPKRNQKVHQRARKLLELRAAKREAAEKEKDAVLNLIAVMEADGLRFYEHGDLKVELDSSKKVKVKLARADEDGEGDDDE